MIRLIGIDIDGTLLDTTGHMPEANCTAMHSAVAAGVHVALVTGLSYPVARPVADALPPSISLIVINGQSGWIGPGGLHLGLNLPELEKLNHKPFKLKGFDKNNVAVASDWDGGALASVPGGCKVGVSVRADPKAAAETVSALAPDHEFSSADPAMRAAKPAVSEILIGY